MGRVASGSPALQQASDLCDITHNKKSQTHSCKKQKQIWLYGWVDIGEAVHQQRAVPSCGKDLCSGAVGDMRGDACILEQCFSGNARALTPTARQHARYSGRKLLLYVGYAATPNFVVLRTTAHPCIKHLFIKLQFFFSFFLSDKIMLKLSAFTTLTGMSRLCLSIKKSCKRASKR